MTASNLKCRGFTYPVVLLIRNSLKQSAPRHSPVVRRSPSVWSIPFRLSTRSFTAGRSLSKAAKAKVVSKSTPSNIPRRPPAAQAVGELAYSHRLAQGNGTVLFEVDSQKLFVFSSYAAAILSFGAAGGDYYFNVAHAPPGVPEWVPVAFTLVAIAFSMFGTTFALKPVGVIRSIRVLPLSATAPKQTGRSPPTVYIEAAATRLLPGLPLKKLVVEPHEIVLKSRVYSPVIAPTAMQSYQMTLDEQKRRKEKREYEMNHLLTSPFRDGAWAFRTLFASFRRGLTGEGFVSIEIQGRRYKLDIAKGYALEGGRALDRIVKIDDSPAPNPFIR